MIRTGMLTAQRLRDVLATIPGIDQIMVDEYQGKFTARLIAARYEDIEDVDRQEEVYTVILREMPRYERRLVEFVFTDSPQEYAEMLAGTGDAAEG